MKQVTGLQLALVSALTMGAAQAQSINAGDPTESAPIPAIQDWSSRSVIHRQPMVPDEFEASGRGGEMGNLYRDPRYVAAVMRRVESKISASQLAPRRDQAQTLSTRSSATGTNKCKDRRRGQCPDDPTAPGSQGSGSVLRDWSNVLGGGANGQGGNGVQGMFPAKYNFDIFAPPDCAVDFVVHPTNAAGASQSGARQEQWSADITAAPSANQTITIGLAGRRQVQLTARTSGNTGRDFQINGTSGTAQNLRDTINRWSGETGFRAGGTGATVTIISNTAGDIDGGSVVSGLTGYSPANTLPGSDTTTPGQPTIIAFNQLYNTTCNATRTNTNAPNVLWSYNTGDGYITETSPALSYLDNGKQVAFVQRNGNTLQLVLLKPGSGAGTAANPATPVFASNAAYRGCSDAGGCYTTISFSTAAGANNNSVGGATWSSPFVDYGTDTLWAGDGNGILHKFTGIFQGTPAEVVAGGFPKVVALGLKLSPPVYAGGNVYVGSQSGSGTVGGKLHRVNATNGTLFSSSKLAVADSTGIRESVIVDNFTGSVFAFLFNDGTTGNGTGCQPTDPGAGNFDACRVVARFATGFADAAAPLQRAYVGRGNSRVSALYAGGFDDDYYNSVDATGAMYIVGGRPNDTYYPTLWKIPLTAGAMGTPVQGPQVGAKSCTGDQPTCSNTTYDWSPVTVIKNPNTELEYLFFSMPKDGNAAGCTGACLYMYRLNQEVTSIASGETWTLRIAQGSFDFGIFAWAGIPANGGSIDLDGTLLTAGTDFITSGNRAVDRTNLVAAIEALSGYNAVSTGGCDTGGFTPGAACDLIITRVAQGNVAPGTVTETLTNVSQTGNVDGSTGGTFIEDIAWGTGNTAGAALPVPGGTSGIIIDNVRPIAETGTSQIYFAQLDTAVLKRWTMTFAEAANQNAGTFTVNSVSFTGNTSATSCTSTGGTFNMSGDARSDASELRACLRAASLPGFTIAGESGAADGTVVVTYSTKGNPADGLVTEAVAGTGNLIAIVQGTASTAGNAIQVSQSALQ